MNDAAKILKTYIAGQAALGYSEFKPGPMVSDIILATFPKSGSTWVSYILHQLRSKADDNFSDIKDEVIDITPGHWNPHSNPFTIQQSYSPRTFKTHGSYELCPKGAKYIYIVRNPKDSFWSLYHFVHDLFALDDKMSLEEFYRNYYVERFGTSHDIGNVWRHILSWYQHRNNPNMLWLHYEDLISKTPECLRKIADFMELELSESTFSHVMTHSKMNHMKSIATQINPSQKNRVGKVVLSFGPEMNQYAKTMKFGKMRKGIAGDGIVNLPENILNLLDSDWRKRITPLLGFSDYESMLTANRLPTN